MPREECLRHVKVKGKIQGQTLLSLLRQLPRGLELSQGQGQGQSRRAKARPYLPSEGWRPVRLHLGGAGSASLPRLRRISFHRLSARRLRSIEGQGRESRARDKVKTLLQSASQPAPSGMEPRSRSRARQRSRSGQVKEVPDPWYDMLVLCRRAR